jgi:hypothetical protein
MFKKLLILLIAMLIATSAVSAGNIQHDTEEFINPGWGFDEAKSLDKLSSNNGELIVLNNDNLLIKFISSNKEPWTLVVEGEVAEPVEFDFFVQYFNTDVYKKSVVVTGAGIEDVCPGITGTGKFSINEIRVATFQSESETITEPPAIDEVAIDDKDNDDFFFFLELPDEEEKGDVVIVDNNNDNVIINNYYEIAISDEIAIVNNVPLVENVLPAIAMVSSIAIDEDIAIRNVPAKMKIVNSSSVTINDEIVNNDSSTTNLQRELQKMTVSMRDTGSPLFLLLFVLLAIVGAIAIRKA